MDQLFQAGAGQPPEAGMERPSWGSSNACIIVVEVVRFGSFSAHVQQQVRRDLYEIFPRAFEESAIPFAEVYREDRGDGVLMIVPPWVEPETLIAELVGRLESDIRRHNRQASPSVRFALRCAIGIGQVDFDGVGVVGYPVNQVFRLLDAPAFKEAQARTGADFALAITDDLYQTVVRPGRTQSVAADFSLVHVQVKETSMTAWVRVRRPGARPGPPNDPDGNEEPALLPRDLAPIPTTQPHVRNFVGREQALAFLDEMAETNDVRVVVVEGGPGVGKTALAREWMTRDPRRFPSGSLWRTNPDPQSTLEEQRAAITRELFEMVRTQNPGFSSEDEAALPRALAGNRALIVIDDVESAQMTRLLLSSPFDVLDVFVLVLGRPDAVETLKANPPLGMRFLHLDPFTPDESVRLLERMLGPELVRVAPEETAKLVELCGGLPLALHMVASRLQRLPGDRISDAVRELFESLTDLDRIDRGEVSMRAVLERSYRELEPEVRRAFRLLSWVEGLEFTHESAAVLLNVSAERSKVLLDELCEASFLDPTKDSRFQMHRLLVALAQELSEAEDSVKDRQEAVERYVAMLQQDVFPEAFLASDAWTLDDWLAYRPYAAAIVDFIRHPATRPPLSIGIQAPWGSGKTSLMRMIQEALDPDRIKIRLTRAPHDRLSRRQTTPPERPRLTYREILRISRADPVPPEELHAIPEEDADRWRPTVWFNPWAYQNGQQIWAGLAHEIIDQITARLSPGDRERFWLQLNLARVDAAVIRRKVHRLLLERLMPLLVIWTIGAVVAVSALVFARLLPDARALLDAFAGTTLGGGTLVLLGFAGSKAAVFLRSGVSGPLARLVKEPDPLVGGHRLLADQAKGALDTVMPDPGYAAKLGFLHLVQTDMRRVLDLVATERRPLVVFVDDLDRCSPGTVAQVVEAINLFLAGEFPNCVFVLGMEPAAVAAHVEAAYPELAEIQRRERRPGDWSTLGWRFLEKIVQLSVSLPPPRGHSERYVRTLLKTEAGAPTDETATTPTAKSPAVADLTKAIRQQRPTPGTLRQVAMDVQEKRTGYRAPLDPETTAAAEAVFAELHNDAAALKSIMSALTVLGTSNPREIKRFVNLYRFYTFITQMRRLHGETAPNGDQLAKLTAFTIRWPHLIGLLAVSIAADGLHPLTDLERCAKLKDNHWKAGLNRLLPTVIEEPMPIWCQDLRDFLANGADIGSAAMLL